MTKVANQTIWHDGKKYMPGDSLEKLSNTEIDYLESLGAVSITQDPKKTDKKQSEKAE